VIEGVLDQSKHDLSLY